MNPTLATSVDPVTFIDETSSWDEAPQNSSELKITGNVTEKYSNGVLIRIDEEFFYSVRGSSYENGKTTVFLTTKTTSALYSFSSIVSTFRGLKK